MPGFPRAGPGDMRRGAHPQERGHGVVHICQQDQDHAQGGAHWWVQKMLSLEFVFLFFVIFLVGSQAAFFGFHFPAIFYKYKAIYFNNKE